MMTIGLKTIGFRTCALLLLALIAGTGHGANWKTCNGVPVRFESFPTPLSHDLCSIPPDSVRWRSFLAALYEVQRYTGAVSFGAPYQHIHNGACVIDHSNGRSEVAVVNRSEIDGNLGLTVKQLDGCTFEWEKEHIEESDVKVADDLTFGRVDESKVIRTTLGAGLGTMVFLHELGHAIGLRHTSEFSVMLSGDAPFVGTTPSSGGQNVAFTGDDVFGIKSVYGSATPVRNVFATSQMLRNGTIQNNNLDPTRGDVVHFDTVVVCPGDKVNFYISVGNTGPQTETFEARIYANASPTDYFPSEVLGAYSVSLGGFGAYAFPAEFTVAPTLPRDVPLPVFVEVDATNAISELKEWDNMARSALQILVRLPGSCGGR